MLPPRLLAAAMHHKGQGAASLCKHPAITHATQPRLLQPRELTPFVDPLPLSPVLTPTRDQRLKITMRESEQRLHRTLPPTRLWTYGDRFPGPVIDARKGQPFSVDWVNALPTEHFLPIDHNLCGAEPDEPAVRAIVHVHGGRLPSKDDGYPMDWYVPGTSRINNYPNAQDAATLWYHDHAMGINRLNMYAGLMGMYLLRDDAELALGLPEGEQEIALLLADRLLTEKGALYYPVSGVADAPWVPEVFGNVTLVNGAIAPHLQVQPRRYRLRVVNGANGRFFHVRLKDGRPFQQIGSDQGLLAAPVSQKALLLAPGERVDLVIDFAALKGQSIELMNDALPLMQFRVGKSAVADTSRVPDTLREVTRVPVSAASRTRELTLDEYADCMAEPMLMMLGGKRWRDPATETPRLGSTEVWNLVNLTEDTHPIHLHLVRFQIVDRRAFDVDHYIAKKELVYTAPAQLPPMHERGWKDVVQTYPGMVTRIVVTFEGYAGKYVWHCHLLEHAANEMMRPLNVLPA